MQIVNLGDNLHELSKPIFWKKIRQISSLFHLDLPREWLRLRILLENVDFFFCVCVCVFSDKC